MKPSSEEEFELEVGGGAIAAHKARQEAVETEKELIGTPWKVRSRFAIAMTILEPSGEYGDQASVRGRIDLVLIESPKTPGYWGLWFVNDKGVGTPLLQGAIDATKSRVERRAQALNDAGEALRDLGSRLWTIGLETP
jgi:hypothetical protein